MRRLTVLCSVAIALVLLGSAPAGAQSHGKDLVVGLGAEPRTMLPVTIVDWTTNNMLEHIYDRLLDRDAKTFKPKPMLAESWRIVNDTTWEFKLRKGVNVVVNEWGTHLDKIKNRNTGDMFFLGWGPSLYGQGTIQPLFLADQTYSSYGNNKTIDEKIARAQTLMEPKARAEAYAELQRLIRDEAPWVFLWQQHDLYGVTNQVEWTPRADEKVWMYDAKVTPR
jgi:ABC-type transport system substrate-binding protein